MTRIAISGHRGLPPEVETLIDQAIRMELSRFATTELGGDHRDHHRGGPLASGRQDRVEGSQFAPRDWH